MVRAWGGRWSLGTSNTSRPLLLQPSSLRVAGATRTQQGPEPRLINGMVWGSEKVAGCTGPWTLQRTVTSPPQKNSLSWELPLSTDTCEAYRVLSPFLRHLNHRGFEPPNTCAWGGSGLGVGK